LGPRGLIGPQGIRGPQGERGLNGDRGLPGEPGASCTCPLPTTTTTGRILLQVGLTQWLTLHTAKSCVHATSTLLIRPKNKFVVSGNMAEKIGSVVWTF